MGEQYDSNKKTGGDQYDKNMKQLLKELGLAPPDEDEEMNRQFPMMYLGGGGAMTPSTGKPSQQIYSTPSSMGSRGYNPTNPKAMQPNMMAPQMPYGMQGMPGDGNTSMININYTSADGTRYSMSVMAPQENKNRALYNVLNGLYGLMTAEDKSGQYKGGKGGGKYAGKRSYAGKN